MSITATYRRITPQEFSELQNDPEAAKSFFGLDLDSFDFSNPEEISFCSHLIEPCSTTILVQWVDISRLHTAQFSATADHKH